MDTEIRVTMLEKFSIYGPGLVRPRVVSLTGRSKRLWTMIAYLILHRDRGVPAQELIETFWSGTEGLNPMSTLQNNISRARNALEELGLEDGKRLIHNNSGTYFWAPDRRTVVDCEEFAKAAKEAQDCSDPAQSLERRWLPQSCIRRTSCRRATGRAGVWVWRPGTVEPIWTCAATPPNG